MWAVIGLQTDLQKCTYKPTLSPLEKKKNADISCKVLPMDGIHVSSVYFYLRMFKNKQTGGLFLNTFGSMTKMTNYLNLFGRGKKITDMP